MPKYITHWILAEKIYLNIDDNSALKEIIKRHKNLYLTGSVILDTPFYLIVGKDGYLMNKLAEKIHDTPDNSYEIIETVIRAYKKQLPDSVLALLLGIITHIQADAVFHPFVYYFSGTGISGKKERARHHILESHMDLYFKDKLDLRNKGLFSEFLKHIEMEGKIFLKVLSILFSQDQKQDQKINIKIIQKALKMNSILQGLFDKNLPRIILQLLNLIPGIDLTDYISYFYPYPRPEPDTLFQHPYNYRHPVTGEKFHHSVDELAKQSIQHSLDLFRSIGNNIKNNSLSELFSLLTGPNLYTGLENTRKTDMHFFNTEKDILEVIFNSP